MLLSLHFSPAYHFASPRIRIPLFPYTNEPAMRNRNFTQCGQTYMSDPSLIARYNYSSHVLNIPANPLTQITYEGCTALCGSGNEYYPWAEISATITTWVLPILGTILQAPFESNVPAHSEGHQQMDWESYKQLGVHIVGH
jgi:hypothetical protein